MVESAVTFLAGAVESCVQIVIVDDSVALEGNETVVVTFAPPSGIQQGSPPSFTLTIIDNDGERVGDIKYVIVSIVYSLYCMKAHGDLIVCFFVKTCIFYLLQL